MLKVEVNIIVPLLVDVDNIMICGPSTNQINLLKRHLHRCFKLKDLVTLKYFHGLELAYCWTSLFLSQRQHTLQLFLASYYCLWILTKSLPSTYYTYAFIIQDGCLLILLSPSWGGIRVYSRKFSLVTHSSYYVQLLFIDIYKK